MLFPAFLSSSRNFIDDSLREMERKNADYAEAGDVCANFKILAPLLGLTPEQVWGVYFLKHVLAILKDVRGYELASEGLDGRIIDAINYLLLYRALRETFKVPV